jgi:hypothetical protein
MDNRDTLYVSYSGVRLTLGLQTLERQIDCFIYFGKRVRRIKDPMVYVTLKTDVLDFLSCPRQKPLI